MSPWDRCFSAIYSIMKLSVKDTHTPGASSMPRTTPTVDELGHNVTLAYAKHMTGLMQQAEKKKNMGSDRSINITEMPYKADLDETPPVI